MINKIYKIKGMHCASCAGIIERTFKKVEGVSVAEVNYGTEDVKLIFNETKVKVRDLSKKIESFGYSIDEQNINQNDNHKKMKNFLNFLK